MAATIKIDGAEYEFPQLETIDLDEAMILYEHSGLTLDQVEQVGNSFHPGLIKGLLHIAVARARPETPKREISDRLGKLKIVELGEAFENIVAEAEQSPPAESPASETGEEPPPSGETSSGAGASSPDESSPSSTGSQGSDTGAASVRRISAA